MGMRLICTLTCVNWHVCTHNDDIVTVYTQTPTVYMYMLVYTHKFQLYVCIYTNTPFVHIHTYTCMCLTVTVPCMCMLVYILHTKWPQIYELAYYRRVRNAVQLVCSLRLTPIIGNNHNDIHDNNFARYQGNTTYENWSAMNLALGISLYMI